MGLVCVGLSSWLELGGCMVVTMFICVCSVIIGWVYMIGVRSSVF